MTSPRIQHHWLVLAVTSAATFLAFLDATVVAIAFPSIVKSFPGSSLADLSWILNGYTIAFSATLVPFGRVADLVGRKRSFIAGLLVFTLGSAACAATPSPEALVAARIVQGLGGAAMIPAALALILGVFPAERRAMAIGIYGASASIAAATGPALGGLIVSVADWRWVFTINLPVGLLAAVAASRIIAERRDEQAGRIPDFAGTLLFGTAVATLALGIVRSADWGWGSTRVVLCEVGAALLLAAFVVRSARHPRPAFELGLWRVPSFSVANAAAMLFSMGFFGMLIVNPLFLTRVWHYSVLHAGLAIAPAALAAGVGAPLGGWLAGRHGQRWVILPGALLFAVSRLWMGVGIDGRPDFLALWLPTTLLAGFGSGMALPALSSAAISDLPPARFATGSAISQTARQVGAVLGVAIVVAILGSAAARDGLSVFRSSYEFSAALGIAGAVVALGLSKRPAAAGMREVAAAAQTASGSLLAANGEKGESSAVRAASEIARKAQTAFVYDSEVFFDDLDAMAMLHNARYAIHVERALTALYGSAGNVWRPDPTLNPDQFHVVKEAAVEYMEPFRGTGAMRVELWVDHLGTSSCQYGFNCRNPEGTVTYATGRRVIVKLDPESLRPLPWTDSFREVHQALVGGGRLNSTLEVRVDDDAAGEA